MAILFDSTHSLHRAVFGNKDRVMENPYFALHSMMFIILKSISDFGASKNNPFIICLDSRQSWRKQWYLDNSKNFVEYKGQTYKGNRKKDTDVDISKIYEIYHELMKSLADHSDLIVLDIDSAEADDCIFWANKYYREKEQNNVIISSDKDFAQLIDDNTSVYCPIKCAFKPPINKDWFLKYHIIQGDKSDNILAIKKGVGPKTAEKMVSEIELILQTNPSMKEKYIFNETLIDLEKSPSKIGEDVYTVLNQPSFNFNSLKLLKEFKKYDLNKASDEIGKLRLQENVTNIKIKDIKKILLNTTSIDEFFDEQ